MEKGRLILVDVQTKWRRRMNSEGEGEKETVEFVGEDEKSTRIVERHPSFCVYDSLTSLYLSPSLLLVFLPKKEVERGDIPFSHSLISLQPVYPLEMERDSCSPFYFIRTLSNIYPPISFPISAYSFISMDFDRWMNYLSSLKAVVCCHPPPLSPPPLSHYSLL